MTLNNRTFLAISAALATLAATGATAQADSEVTVSSRNPVIDVEVDPIAYALGGYSLHAGFTWDRVRLDLGAFALEVPEALHGAEGLEIYGSGFGAKLDVHPLRSLPGLLVGAQLSRFRETATATSGRESKAASHITVGARIGYRIDIAKGFYALPWIGVDVSLTDRSQTVAGFDYEPGRAMFFPTIHLGKRF